MKPTVVFAGRPESAAELEEAGVSIIRAADAEDAVRAATANSVSTIVLDRQHCGSLELVAAVSHLTADDDDRRVIVIDGSGGQEGDELTQALRRRAHVAVCHGGTDAAVAVAGRVRSGPFSPSEARTGSFVHGRTGPEHAVAVLQPQVLPVVSAKGGVGKTTIAANLATMLAAATTARTVLADLATTNSDVGVLLELPEGPGLADVVASPARLTEIPRQAGTKLSVLTGLAKPEDGEKITQQQIETLISALRRQFEVVVLDLGSDPTSDALYCCLEQASTIILVSSLDAASLKDTRLFLNLLKRLNIKVSDRVRLVLNRVRNDGTMDQARAEEFLGIAAAAIVPDDPRAVDSAAYSGVPLCQTRPNHPVTNALWQLAKSISPAFERPGQARSQGLWRRARG